MPQGRDINEAGPKSVTLVTIANDRSIRVEERITSVAQFERISVDVSGLEDWRDLVAAVTRALEKERDALRSEYLVARVRITGATPLAWRIRRDADLLKTEADDRGSVIGGCWIEQLEIACRPAEQQGQTSGDPIRELHRLIEDDVFGSEAFRSELMGVAEEIRAQLPQECRDVFGSDEASFKKAIAHLAREGAEGVMARLESVGEET
jgi:DNA repair exonuclease SbcCD nuclease subunit